MLPVIYCNKRPWKKSDQQPTRKLDIIWQIKFSQKFPFSIFYLFARFSNDYSSIYHTQETGNFDRLSSTIRFCNKLMLACVSNFFKTLSKSNVFSSRRKFQGKYVRRGSLATLISLLRERVWLGSSEIWIKLRKKFCKFFLIEIITSLRHALQSKSIF